MLPECAGDKVYSKEDDDEKAQDLGGKNNIPSRRKSGAAGRKLQGGRRGLHLSASFLHADYSIFQCNNWAVFLINQNAAI